MEQIFILVIFAAIALMKWLASNKAGDFTPGPPKDTTSAYGPIQRREEDTEEARMRRFMEALGVPPGSAPRPPLTKLPPPIARPAVEPPRVPRTQKLPPKIAPVAPPKTRVEIPSPVFETVLATREKSFVELAESKKSFPSPELAASLQGGDFRRLLKSGVSLRDAVILREILGPPRSLQSSL